MVSKDNIVQLNLKDPVAVGGGPTGVWIADGEANTVTRFDAETGKPLLVVPLEETPVDVAVVNDSAVISLADGSIAMYGQDSGDEILRHRVVSRDSDLRSAGDSIWVLDREVSALVALDLAGNRRVIQSGTVIAFTAGSAGVHWISDDGMIRFGGGDNGQRLPTLLPVDPSQLGAIVECGNSLWVSVPHGLLMVSVRSLKPGNILSAPEGPVPHLICDDDRRIFGGGQGLFVLDFTADANIHAVDVNLGSELRALVAAGDRIWALETDEPIAHILQIL